MQSHKTEKRTFCPANCLLTCQLQLHTCVLGTPTRLITYYFEEIDCHRQANKTPISLRLSLDLSIATSAFDPEMAICIPVVVDALANLYSTQPADMCLADCAPTTQPPKHFAHVQVQALFIKHRSQDHESLGMMTNTSSTDVSIKKQG